MEYYGIRGSTHKWINSWLSGRTQQVVLDGQASGPVPVLSAVSQVSVLGTVLFLIYKNDLPDNIRVSKVAKIRNRYNQVPHLTQDTNGKVTNSQKTPQTRAKRSGLLFACLQTTVSCIGIYLHFRIVCSCKKTSPVGSRLANEI